LVILDIFGDPQEDADVTQQFAGELLISLDNATPSFEEAERITAVRENFISGRFVEPIRVAGHATTVLSAGNHEAIREEVRFRSEEEEDRPLRTERVRIRTEVNRTNVRVMAAISGVMVSGENREDYEEDIRQIEESYDEIITKILDFVLGRSDEDCGNGLDDDEDGLVDCDDPDCANRVCG
jgi:hypothetical protein